MLENPGVCWRTLDVCWPIAIAYCYCLLLLLIAIAYYYCLLPMAIAATTHPYIAPAHHPQLCGAF